MNIQINGENYETAPGLTLAELLAEAGFKTANLLVEYNGEILTRPDEWAAISLADGDRINLFSLVAGG
ncbi:MAG: sulfur carrier protein ThiS [Victivallaceae bacterium]